MRALHFDHFGTPEVLTVHHAAEPVATPDQAVIAVKAASVNPSDVKNVGGAFPSTVLPRVPGRDFAGVVVDGPTDWVGAEVWGTGGDIGFSRDGSHAELLAVPVDALVRMPAGLSFDDAATAGVHFVTAWLGAVRTAGLTTGETIAVFGVSGGVGGAVAQIAAARGARVIGVGRTPPRADSPAATHLDEFVSLDGHDDVAARIRAATGGRGADVVYDAVGGVTTAAALASVARRGRVVAISAVGNRTVTFDLIDFYRNETQLLGVDSTKLGVVAAGALLSELTPYFESGAFRPLPVAHTYGLDDAPSAYQAVAAGTSGRVVLHP
ncbi:zinc-binding alcohol dehydrogenase family protein [Mycolicibacterium sp. P1-18]|uniref:quinone oxidoreductase family protein n=1 Tax=Mycolicibacterium sp. P1-18 TaxID=2024615 RepID=UPI0011F233A5|nr:zinc-binding alcohol dehydrogenase family protein [Mycolicibacterium sp. P1-18]KAA0099590.1 zinc-binding alcohol dehydrogenase family protein [Mycolicibacterium sp. P1-18]